MLNKSYTYLALGDSYTVGEGVALFESFPYQVVQLLRSAGYNVTAPEIFAKTGWTCADLKQGIKKTHFQQTYHFVSLLIGVNDQYQSRPVSGYAPEFEQLLEQAIRFAGGKPAHVFVLPVPDWSATPFAAGANHEKIAVEIQSFNKVNEQIARKYQVTYLPVTLQSMQPATGGRLLADDQLHPSGAVYAVWAGLLAEAMQKALV